MQSIQSKLAELRSQISLPQVDTISSKELSSLQTVNTLIEELLSVKSFGDAPTVGSLKVLEVLGSMQKQLTSFTGFRWFWFSSYYNYRLFSFYSVLR